MVISLGITDSDIARMNLFMEVFHRTLNSTLLFRNILWGKCPKLSEHDLIYIF